MGRIADALRRAERERLRHQRPDRTATDAGVGATAIIEPPTPDPEEPRVDEPAPVIQGLSESLVPFYERSSLVTEQYRSLRTRLLSQNTDYEHRTIAVTSAVPKEGKSVTTLNLSCILAEIRHLKVLAVDGDFRRSSLAPMLSQPSGPGLADVLSGEADYDDVLQPTPIPNLFLLPAGSTQGRSAPELLTAATAAPVFRRIQNDFHYTIVDTPPATTVTDVGIIGQMCTGVIMLVRLHRTHEGAAKRAVRLLQVNNIPVIGCLLVGRDAPGLRYGYGYSYYNYRGGYYRYNEYYKNDEPEPGPKKTV